MNKESFILNNIFPNTMESIIKDLNHVLIDRWDFYNNNTHTDSESDELINSIKELTPHILETIELYDKYFITTETINQIQSNTIAIENELK